MKTARTVLLALSLVYVVVTVILLMNEENLYNSMNLIKLMDYFKMWMILGVILLAGVLLADSLYIRSIKGALHRIEGENMATKARIYDIENARKTEDEQAGRRIEAFRQSLDKGGRSGSTPSDTPTSPQV
jgi:hypothetical protein